MGELTDRSAGQGRKRTRIQELNEKKILDAALEVFSLHGFRGSTLDRIAAGASMSKPNLLYYFSSKEDIYVSVLRQTLGEWLEPLKALDADGDPVDEICRYISIKLEMSRTHSKASRLFANEILHGAPMINAFLEGSLRTLVDEKAEVIQGWIDQGRIAPVDPHHLIFMIWATTQHYADFEVQIRSVLATPKRDADYFERAEATIKAIFMSGLKPRYTDQRK